MASAASAAIHTSIMVNLLVDDIQRPPRALTRAGVVFTRCRKSRIGAARCDVLDPDGNMLQPLPLPA